MGKGLLTKFAAIAPLVLLLATGCGGSNKEHLRATAAMERQLEQKDQEVQTLRTQISEMERKVSAAERTAAEAANATTTSSHTSSAAVGSNLLPPDARPGECYAKVIVPAELKTTTERVVKRPASHRVEIIPAKYEWATEKVMVKPASKKLVEVPATYKTETEKILVRPARTLWKAATGSDPARAGMGASGGSSAQEMLRRYGGTVIETRMDDTGEVMCLVEEPAVYKTVTRKVVDRPAGSREVEIPAEYKTIRVQRVASEAQERRIEIPAEYQTITKTEKVADERIEWAPALCQVNMTRENITALQRALKKTGCYSCEVDGYMGPCTMNAIKCYAKRNNLPYARSFVPMQIIKSLGLKF